MIDFTKPVQTRDGRKVRILCTDGNDSDWPIVGFIEGQTETDDWQVSGKWSDFENHSSKDLINVPEKRTVWVNFYADAVEACGHDSRKAADESASSNRIACVKVEFTVGEGL